MIEKNFKKRIFTSLILFSLLFLTLISQKILLTILLIAGILSLLEFFNLSNRIFKNNFFLSGFNLIITIYLFLFFCYFAFLSYFFQQKILLFLLLFGCIASDLGGYIFGSIFKGPKLTKVSPNKTYSGSIGSIILTVFIFYIFCLLTNNYFSIKFLILAIITSIACQAGDLFVSFLKRKANSKDTGSLLPGHGGILDRLDGIYLGIPVGYLSIILLF